MKKNLYGLLVVACSISTQAQVPANYYEAADGLSSYTLKSKLKEIITAGHHTNSYGDLYDIYRTSDVDNYYEKDGSVLDMYSENPNGTDPYHYTHGDRNCGNYNSENDCYNREHIIPQSVFSKKLPMRADAHFVVPSDGYVNGKRSSYAFGEVTAITTNIKFTSQNGSKVGDASSSTGFNGTVFEPIDEFKGDIARMLFYFATRYETQVDSWGWAMFNGSEDQVFTDWAKDLLVDWHTQDPVSQREIDRNNAIYNAQNNANPFISHPEYVGKIWGTVEVEVDTEKPSATTLNSTNQTSASITVNWEASRDNVAVVNYKLYKDNQYVATLNALSYTFTNLNPSTSYNLGIEALDAANNVSIRTSINVSTKEVSDQGVSMDLFFSEYVEGSSSNKALEIANFTGEDVDLSNYSVKLRSNTDTNWRNPLNLAGSLASGEVYVISNKDADLPDIIANTDITSDVCYFNGNDDLALFKNGVLIDMIGYDNLSANFAKDVTLRRKSTVNKPTTSYTPSEWDIIAKNDASDLGNHSVLSIANHSQLIKENILYPNPSDGKVRITKPYQWICIFDLSGRIVYEDNYKGTSLDLSTLAKGLYIVKFKINENYIVQKISIL